MLCLALQPPKYVLRFDRAAGDLPSRPPISELPAQGWSRLAAFLRGHRRLGLERPEHGGMLDRIGSAGRLRLETTGAGRYCPRARATSWRRTARGLRASSGSLIYVLPI